ncbi:hypothetical protein STEG23_003403, partial [Scotinomys teguina]
KQERRCQVILGSLEPSSGGRPHIKVKVLEKRPQEGYIQSKNADTKEMCYGQGTAPSGPRPCLQLLEDPESLSILIIITYQVRQK